jgi:hypothetical protein
MKVILFLMIFFSSCTTLKLDDYGQSITVINKCWNEKRIKCIKQYFGVPQKVELDQISYLRDGHEYLIVYFDDLEFITNIHFNLFDPDYITVDFIKRLLPAKDWSSERIPDNLHVVYLALANFSKSLSVSFVTYETDKPQKIEKIYWGGDYKSLQAWP